MHLHKQHIACAYLPTVLARNKKAVRFLFLPLNNFIAFLAAALSDVVLDVFSVQLTWAFAHGKFGRAYGACS